ncbi:MAG: glycosyltransferase family 2 protein [Thermomicrobiales bacterium]|nr:glycosyltransferase family 2 protein [Thermomicrobiales bacterium]
MKAPNMRILAALLPMIDFASPAVKAASTTSPVLLPGSLSLVLPCHNEEDNIRIVIEQALAVLPNYASTFEIIPVNDGSKDRTGAILAELADEDDRVRPVSYAVNKGYGGALTSGFDATQCDYIMFMDADRQFDIGDISRLAPFVGSFDIVAGFRMERSDPLIRRVNAEVFNIAVRILFGVHLRDLDCAFKIFRGDQLRSLELISNGALINCEMQAKLRRQGATLQQVGVQHYPRVAGNPTGGNLKVILKAMRDILILWWKMRDYHPEVAADRTAPDDRVPARLKRLPGHIRNRINRWRSES